MAPAGRPFVFTEKVLGLVVEVQGEQDLATASALDDALRRAGDRPCSQIRVDLHAVTFMDCAGLRPLVQARDRLGDRVCLWNPSPAVTRLLQLTGLLDTFVVIADPAAVAEYCGPLARSTDRGQALPSSRRPLLVGSRPSPDLHHSSPPPRVAPQGDRRRRWGRPCQVRTAVAVRIRAITQAGSGERNA